MQDSGKITVPSTLADAGPTLRTDAGQFLDLLDDLKTQLQPLDSTWTGDARTTYQDYQAEWDASAQGLFGVGGVLDRIASAMDTVNENYAQAESTNVKNWAH